MALPDRSAAGRNFTSAAPLGAGKICPNRVLFLSTTALCGLLAAGLVGMPGAARAGDFVQTYSTARTAAIVAYTSDSYIIQITTTSAATVISPYDYGVRTIATDGPTTINIGANVSSRVTGIDAYSSGIGDITITSAAGAEISSISAISMSGSVNLGGEAGLGGAVGVIVASTSEAGNVSIKTAGGRVGTSDTDYAIYARTYSGSLNIDLGANVTALSYGIDASTTTGAITIKTAEGVSVTGAIEATSTNGGAVSVGGDTGLGGTVSSGSTGIFAKTDGAGTITVKTLADVTGTTEDGIRTSAKDGATTIFIGSAATVTGGSAAIKVATQNGNVTVANLGTVKGNIVSGEFLAPGSGTFTFNNSGTLALTGAQANTGFTINNQSGGVLTGNSTGSFGTVNAQAGSTIRPGDRADGGVVMGTLNTGNLTLASGAIVEVRADYTAGSDKVAVTGNATLGGATLKILATPKIDATWATSKTFTVLTATGTITGTFASVTTDYAFLKFTADYSTTGAVKVTGQRNGMLLQPYARSSNQKSVAVVFDGLQTSTSPLIAKVATLTVSGATVALNQLSGTGVTTARTQAFDAVGVFSSTVSAQMGQFTGSAGGAGGLLSYAEDQGLKTKAFDKIAPKAQPIADSRVWAHLLGAVGNMKADAATASPSQRSTNFGLAAGVDTALTPNVRAGFALAGGQSASKVAEAATKSDAAWGQGSAYAVATDGARYAKASLTYGYISSETERTVTAFGTPEKATGKFGANLYSARLEVGQKFATAPVGVTPFAAVEPSWLMQKGYSETASTIGLTYGASVSRAMPATLGVTFDTRFDLADMRVAPSATFGWVHNFTSSSSISPFFTALPGSNFTVQGAKGDRDLARIDLNVEATPNGSLASFYINARADLGARTNVARGMAGAMLRF